MPKVSKIDTVKIIRESFLMAPFLITDYFFLLDSTLTSGLFIDADPNQLTTDFATAPNL